MGLDYCVWAVSTSQLKENEREEKGERERDLRDRERKGGTSGAGIFKQ